MFASVGFFVEDDNVEEGVNLLRIRRSLRDHSDLINYSHN